MRRALLALGLLAAFLLSACGSDYREETSLLVFGASSLDSAMGDYAESFPDVWVRTSFAGSDQLAAQIRHGAAPDVFASADTSYPAQLYKAGLIERPVVFAGNRLVLAASAASEVSSLADLARPGVKLVVGDPSVPVGAYTRTVLDRLPASERKGIEANVRSEEPEVSSVLAKLELGAADAGFVYATDIKGNASLREIPIPPRLQPDVAYAAAVVKGTEYPALAHEFLHGLLHGEGATDLRRAGFLAPP
jgi:molybdate transport system substrate-binding protein